MTDDVSGDQPDDQPAVDGPDFAATLAQRALQRLEQTIPTPPAAAGAFVEPVADQDPAVLPPSTRAEDPAPVSALPISAAPVAAPSVVAAPVPAAPVSASPVSAAPVSAAPVLTAPASPELDRQGGSAATTTTTTATIDEPINTPIRAPAEPDDFSELDADNDTFSLRWLAEWVAVLVGAVVVALILRAVLFQVFFIPSPSMEPTLQKGDRVMVFKLDTTPERGEIMVFERPPSSTAGEINDLIKRVIGLPGETIRARDGEMYIDDQLLIEPYTIGADQGNRKPVWRPECANERGDGESCLIPEDSYFMMGDNRSQSADSRVFGPISGDLFVGRAVLQIWPLADFERL